MFLFDFEPKSLCLEIIIGLLLALFLFTLFGKGKWNRIEIIQFIIERKVLQIPEIPINITVKTVKKVIQVIMDSSLDSEKEQDDFYTGLKKDPDIGAQYILDDELDETSDGVQKKDSLVQKKDSLLD